MPIIILISCLACITLLFLLWFLIQGAPFVRSNDKAVDTMVLEVKRVKSKRIIDLGCGDGKLVIALAKLGYRVDGIEIKPWLVWRAKKRVKKLGIEDKVNIYWGNMWKFKVSKYDTVLLFAIPHIMPRLERKLKAELKPGSSVISHHFVFPNIKPARNKSDILSYKF